MQDLFGNEIIEKKHKDWTGNARSVFTCNGDRNFTTEERQTEDFYATEPRAVEELLEREKFSSTIFEPCVGMGHIAKVLVGGGTNVLYLISLIEVFLEQKLKTFLF
jgi:hypothetical protein